jgi:hypothetical protein
MVEDYTDTAKKDTQSQPTSICHQTEADIRAYEKANKEDIFDTATGGDGGDRTMKCVKAE